MFQVNALGLFDLAKGLQYAIHKFLQAYQVLLSAAIILNAKLASAGTLSTSSSTSHLAQHRLRQFWFWLEQKNPPASLAAKLASRRQVATQTLPPESDAS